MSYILHIESGNKFEIDGKTAADLQVEIKAAGLIIGNVTLRRMIEGVLDSANGFELIDSLSQEEQEETSEALARAQEEQATAVSQEVADAAVLEAPENSVASPEPAAEDVKEPEPDLTVGTRAEEVRRRMLGGQLGDAVNTVRQALEEGDNPKDDAALAAAQSVINKAAKDMSPSAAVDERKRRHNKREEMVETARASAHGALLAAVEAGVVPGVFLSYVNPDMRWFQFPVTELADPANIHARTNTYVDLAPVVAGGWGFSLYVNGKSYTKRQKVKENDAESLVKAINAWLPGVLAEAKAAA